MTEPIVCPGCDKVRPGAADLDAGPQVWHAAEKAYGPCCNVLCGGKWKTACFHCHHPSYATMAMREAVERWARAKGWLSSQHAHGHPGHWLCDPFRGVVAENASPSIWEPDGRQHDVEVPTLFVWALLAEAGLPPVDVGKCPACVKRGGRFEWAHLYNSAMRRNWAANGWGIGEWHWVGEVKLWSASRPCPDCNGTGREHRDPARMVLGAEFHDELTARADRLQADGSLVGLQLALWLNGQTASLAPAIAWLDSRKQDLVCPTCDAATPGVCCGEGCGRAIRKHEQVLAPNPYANEIHGDNSLHLECALCSYESAQDI